MSAVRNVQKIFVANLPWTVSSRELRQYFAEFGHVTNASVVFDRDSGISKGYGFVAFSTQGGIDAVLNKSHHTLDGANLTIQPSN